MSAPDPPKEPEIYTPEPDEQQIYYPEPGEQQVYTPEEGGSAEAQVYYPEGVTPPGAGPDESPPEPTDALGRMRRDYTRAGLLEAHAGYEPFALFRRWFEEATLSKVPEPNAMTLATVGRDGSPSARIVLLKGADEAGFVFFSNYLSRKGEELASRPRAALVFFWAELERQVRVEGSVERVSASESDAYFASRPAGSKLGAWASQQSRPASSREELDRALAARGEEYSSGEVPRPPHWGGYRVVAESVEFWQGRTNRMHDRIRFRRAGLRWLRERLNP